MIYVSMTDRFLSGWGMAEELHGYEMKGGE